MSASSVHLGQRLGFDELGLVGLFEKVRRVHECEISAHDGDHKEDDEHETVQDGRDVLPVLLDLDRTSAEHL